MKKLLSFLLRLFVIVLLLAGTFSFVSCDYTEFNRVERMLLVFMALWLTVEIPKEDL